MTNKLEISRELAERLLSYQWFNRGGTQNGIDLRLLDRNELRALIATPVVERQDRRDMAAEVHLMKRERQEPAVWIDPASLKHSDNEKQWVRIAGSLAENRTNGYTMPLYAEQPAPVAVVNLRNFANAMIDIALEGCDADGGHIQELAIKHGLLKPEQRTERCGDTCSCAEYADFPVECFRKVKELNQ